MRASTSISISLTFCNWSGVSTARMSCETWARCTARSDSSEATFAACARMAVSSMVSAWIVSRKARRSVTTCLISGPTVGWYLWRMVFTSAFWSVVTPSCASFRAKRPLLKPTSLVVFACARNAKKPPTVAAATAPAAINAFVCVFIFLYPFHQYKTRQGWGRLREFYVVGKVVYRCPTKYVLEGLSLAQFSSAAVAVSNTRKQLSAGLEGRATTLHRRTGDHKIG